MRGLGFCSVCFFFSESAVSLAALRERVAALPPPDAGAAGLRFSSVAGDIRSMHPRLEKSMVQVASQ